MCKHKVLLYKYYNCTVFTQTYSTTGCTIIAETQTICREAIDAKSLKDDTANIEVEFLCASCVDHSKEEEESYDEGIFSTDTHDPLKRYAYEHRQAVVAASARKSKKLEEEEAKMKEEAEAKEKTRGNWRSLWER